MSMASGTSASAERNYNRGALLSSGVSNWNEEVTGNRDRRWNGEAANSSEKVSVVKGLATDKNTATGDKQQLGTSVIQKAQEVIELHFLCFLCPFSASLRVTNL